MDLLKKSSWECETRAMFRKGNVQIYKDTVTCTKLVSEVIDYLLECKSSHQRIASIIIKKRNGD